MFDKTRDTKRLTNYFEAFFPIGANPDGISVTRLGYTEVEDEMHALFVRMAESEGFTTYTDEVGNTYAASSMAEPYILVGSHLDSVVQGGRYDGPAGVIGGLLLMVLLKEAGLDIPLRVAAFRCEESSNFGCATMGSGLITGALTAEKVQKFKGRDGVPFTEVFTRRGHSLTPKMISGLKAYFEIHIEQGKVLEETRTQIGVVTSIAGPRRFSIELRGLAEHSGATPMGMRADALCAAAEIILALEKIATAEPDSVATVGVVHNTPNALNVVPGLTQIGVDLRSITNDSLDRMEAAMRTTVQSICEERGVFPTISFTSGTAPVALSPVLIDRLSESAERLGISYRRMPSGAGHDAMEFPPLCDTGMLFIPCEKGISHNGLEQASLEDLLEAVYVLFDTVTRI
jgi:N-carbamoyl-L-amino-acid hydrolase